MSTLWISSYTGPFRGIKSSGVSNPRAFSQDLLMHMATKKESALNDGLPVLGRGLAHIALEEL